MRNNTSIYMKWGEELIKAKECVGHIWLTAQSFLDGCLCGVTMRKETERVDGLEKNMSSK